MAQGKGARVDWGYCCLQGTTSVSAAAVVAHDEQLVAALISCN